MQGFHRLKLRHLHSFVAVAETGSLVRAADTLSITQPAVSKSLAELEEIVGHRLFDRMPRGVRLTSAGRVLLGFAGSSLRAIREGLDSIAGEAAVDAPSIAIGALPTVAATVLPGALLRFATAYPQARVAVRTGSNAQMIAALRQGLLDMVVGRLAEPSAMRGLTFEHLYSEPLVLVVRPGHALSRRRKLAVDALSAHRFVLPDAGTRARDAADRFFLASGMGLPQHMIESIDVAFGRRYVLQSDAVWCIPFGVVEHDLANGTLHRLPVDTSLTEGPVGLTLRVDRVVTPAMETLLGEIRRAAAARAGVAR
ncbi:pca operon transcription factor PcaQ [Ramlibacter sp.]|uniref:pca operon transcription factor PcaQ n=1 Tax=Ramlibacter sp. TaxID=1917967 RepID=UPI003D0E86FC